MKPLRTAVFPVAGLGTRSFPATKVIPKEMLTVVDKPIIQFAVEEARAAGIESLVFVTSRGKTLMEDHFDQHRELYEMLDRRGKVVELASARAAEIPVGLARHADRLLFCDTCATTTALWHELLFGAPHPQIQTLEAHRRYALTLVCDPDAPFVDDTHRISEHTRQPFSELLLQHLSTTPEPVVHLRGDWDARFEAALAALSRQFPWAQTR